MTVIATASYKEAKFDFGHMTDFTPYSVFVEGREAILAELTAEMEKTPLPGKHLFEIFGHFLSGTASTSLTLSIELTEVGMYGIRLTDSDSGASVSWSKNLSPVPERTPAAVPHRHLTAVKWSHHH